MTITPLELLDTSIAQLQTLVAFLDDQLDTRECATAEACACKEIARSLGTLIRTYQSEYPAVSPHPTRERARE